MRDATVKNRKNSENNRTT